MDGTGYPDRSPATIFRSWPGSSKTVDIYDALTNPARIRRPTPRAQALEIMQEEIAKAGGILK